MIKNNAESKVQGGLSPLLFMSHAIDFYNSYCRISGDNHLAESYVAYFLLCRSIELSIKAFLLEKGFSEKNLKNIGHDLIKAQKEAKKNGLGIKIFQINENKDILKNLNQYYKEINDFTYPRLGYKQYFYVYYVQRLARKYIFYISKKIVKELGKPANTKLNESKLKIDCSKFDSKVANRYKRDEWRRRFNELISNSIEVEGSEGD